MKIKIILFLLLISMINVSADDSIYIISGNTILKQGDFRIIVLDNITSDLMIDSTQIYFFTKNYEYFVNSTTGLLNFKIQIQNILEQKQTDTYIMLKTLNSVYTVRKDNGTIETHNKYHFGLDGIFSLFGVGNGSTIINNYYSCGNCTNGTNGINGTNGTNGLNQSDNSKLNKTGDKFESSNSIFSSYYDRINMKIIDSLTPINTHKIDILFSGGNLTRISPAGIYSPFFESVSGYKDTSKTGSTDRFAIFNTTGHIISGINPNQSDNSKLNKSGDIMTGDIFLEGGHINQTLKLGSQGSTIAGWSSMSLGTISYNLYAVNRFWNISGAKWENGTYPERWGSAIWVEGAPDRTSLMWYTFPPNSTTATRRQFLNQNDTETTIQYAGLAGSGNDYACLDSTGKLFRQNAVC